MIRRLAISGTALLLLLTAAVAAAGTLPPGGTFSDDDGNIHEANIEAIAAEGITRDAIRLSTIGTARRQR